MTYVQVGCSAKLTPLPAHPVSDEDRLLRESVQGSASARTSAARRLERLRFQQAQRQDTALGWTRFLKQHSQGLFAERARDQLALRRFAEAERRRDLAAFRRFLRLHADHPLAAKAWLHVVSEEGRTVLIGGRRQDVVNFLDRHPRSDLAPEMRRRLEELDRQALGPRASAMDMERFLRVHPSSPQGEIIRQRLEKRWADIVSALGDSSDLRAYRERFPQGAHLANIRSRVEQRELLEALAQGDAPFLAARVALVLSALPHNRRRVLAPWQKDGGHRLASLSVLVRDAIPFRPPGRLPGLVKASRIGDPPTASFALAALSFVPRLAAGRALMEALTSPNAGVALEALRSLRRWVERSPGSSARNFLIDFSAEAKRGRGGGGEARVVELGVLWALKDTPALMRALSARDWHRPWDVLPHVLWLEVLAPDSPDSQRVGALALAVFRQELRRLSQMFPRTIDEQNRHRATGSLFELTALANALRQLGERHSGGSVWAEKLRGLAVAANQRAVEARRALANRFPQEQPLVVDTLWKDAERHGANQKTALVRLRARVAAMGLPPEILALLCSSGLDMGKPCTAQ